MSHSSDEEILSSDEEQEVVYDDLTNPDTVQKYKVAADIANDTLSQVIARCVVGARIVDLCSFGDNMMQERTAKVYNKGNVEKGLAFPTCISVNHCAGHFSPLVEATDELKAGDVVKIDLAVHVDGYTAALAQTLICSADPKSTEPVTGRAADVIQAAWLASEAASRLVKVGNTNAQVTDAINKIATAFNCKALEGVLSHQMKRNVLDGPKVIINRLDADHTVDEVTFEEGDVFAVDIVMSTGEGVAREVETKPLVYQRTGNAYSLKLKASRFVFGEITRRFPTFPFALRSVDDEKRGRLGIVECLKHELVQAFPVLYEKQGELVAQIKFTILLTPSGPQRITNPIKINAESSHKLEDQELVALIAAPLSSKKKNKKKKKAAKKSNEKDDEEGSDNE